MTKIMERLKKERKTERERDSSGGNCILIITIPRL